MLLSEPISALSAMPSDADIIRLAVGYVDRYYGDSNFDPQTNGEYSVLERLLPHCHRVFDVGASSGVWSSQALKINSALNIHCFEPLPRNQAGLMDALKDKVVINLFALGAENCKKTLYSLPEQGAINWQLASIYARNHHEHGNLQEITVDVLTVEEYCRRANISHIDFLKIDVEGAEVDVLKGAASLFREERIMAAQFEYGATWLDSRCQLRDVFDLLEGMNYAMVKIIPETCLAVDKYWSGLDSFRYSNWLIVHRDIVGGILQVDRLSF